MADAPSHATLRLHRWLRRVVAVEPQEVAALLLGFAYFFCLLASYYLVRPLRDAMGLVGGAGELQWLFSATFAVMLALVPVFGWLSARLPPTRFVPIVYRFFAANMLVFSVLIGMGVKEAWVAKVFFVWISVFNLFVVSIFWSVLADSFTNPQGRRLFGFIAAGGTLGTIVGPLLAASTVTALGPVALTLAAALLLELAVQCFHGLVQQGGLRGPASAHEEGRADGSGARTQASHAAASPAGQRIGGGVMAGLSLVARSPYLLGIVVYMLLHTTTATFLYFEQARIVAASFADTASRTRFFAQVDLAVSLLTLALQLLLTGRVIKQVGVTGALVALPVAAMAAFAGLAAWPIPLALGALQGVRRAVDYAVARPAREILFTVLGREEKYKAKSFIETVVYRGGDAVSGWLSAGLTAIGVGIVGVAVMAVPLTAAWGGLCVWLGRRQDAMAKDGMASVTPAEPGRCDELNPRATLRRDA